MKKYIIKPMVYLFVMLFIVFEEYIWDKIFKYIYIKIKNLDLISDFKEYLLKEDNRYIILLIFLLPFMIMEGVSILGLIFIGKGFIILGLSMYLIKILATIPVVIIFNSGKKRLLSFYLIKLGYFLILKFKRSKIYRNTKKNIINYKNDFKKVILIKFKEIKAIFSDSNDKFSFTILFDKTYKTIKRLYLFVKNKFSNDIK